MRLNTMLADVLNDGWEIWLHCRQPYSTGAGLFIAQTTDGRDRDDGVFEGYGDTPQDAVTNLVAVLAREHPDD